MDAKGCKFRARGRNRTELDEARILLDYFEMFAQTKKNNRPPAEVAELPARGTDLDYETDAVVTEEDAENGIQAWRRIVDPLGVGPDVFLPIYRSDFIGDLSYLVPRTGDDEHPELHVDYIHAVYRLVVLWHHLSETPVLWGAAGLGKTETYRHMAWLMGLPFWRISVTASTEVDDLVGKMNYSPERGTYWTDGRLPAAWRSPGVICLDEPNVGPPDVWQLIRPLTDNSKQLVLDQNQGERIQRHPASFLGMAMNPSWDPRNTGTNLLGDADGSRLMHMMVPLPPEKVEREIIKRRVALDGWEMESGQLDLLMAISQSLRELVSGGSLAEVSWGVRHTIKVARVLRFFTMSDAVRMAVADYLAPELQQAVLDQVKLHTERPRPKRDVSTVAAGYEKNYGKGRR